MRKEGLYVKCLLGRQTFLSFAFPAVCVTSTAARIGSIRERTEMKALPDHPGEKTGHS